jgi:hypothetical protein
MATTYTLISSNTLASDTASVTFSSITNTYTDLVLKASIRTTASGANSQPAFVLNSNTGSIYSFTRNMMSGSSTMGSSTFTGQNAGDLSYGNGDTSQSNTFSSLEIYIPSYTASRNKILFSIISQENSTTAALTTCASQLFRSTTAISSIQITDGSGNNLKSGSIFYLYGISNA